jgi:hypothetical protein
MPLLSRLRRRRRRAVAARLRGYAVIERDPDPTQRRMLRYRWNESREGKASRRCRHRWRRRAQPLPRSGRVARRPRERRARSSRTSRGSPVPLSGDDDPPPELTGCPQDRL